MGRSSGVFRSREVKFAARESDAFACSPSGKAFEQPCTALLPQKDAARVCAIYEDRPRSCRDFECRLHHRYRREGGGLEPSLAVVRRVRELLASIDVLDGVELAELEKLVNEDFARA